MTAEDITLQQLCFEQAEPYISISDGDPKLVRRMKTMFVAYTDVPFGTSKMYVGRVKNATIFGKSYVSDRPGRAVFSNQGHRNTNPKEFQAYYDEAIHNVVNRSHIGECCFLGGFSAEHRFFGHFIFEFLYRLVAFDTAGLLKRLPVVVFDDVPEPWLSFLRLYGVTNIIKIPQSPAPVFEKVWVTSCPNLLDVTGYRFWDAGIDDLRNLLRYNAHAHTGGWEKRVFIGRKDASHRRLVNEAQVWAMLEPLGFVYAEFAGKDAVDQIRAVGSAEIIVAVGGSASVMTHFAPADCKIIEILASGLVGALGSLGFAAVIGQEFTRVHAHPLSGSPQEADMTVDMEAVERAVKSAISGAGT